MHFEVGTAIAQLVSIALIGIVFYVLFLIIRHFRSETKRLNNIEKKIDKLLENQNNV